MEKQTKRLCMFMPMFIIWLFCMVWLFCIVILLPWNTIVGGGNNKNDIMVIESNAENSIKPCPPGYKILCDSRGRYLPVMPYGTRLYKNQRGYISYDNRKDAIERAWEQYEFSSSPPDTVNWHDCTGGDAK